MFSDYPCLSRHALRTIANDGNVKNADSELSAKAAQLLFSYARAVDDGDFGALAELIAHDVVLHSPGGIYQGRDDFIEVYRSVRASRSGGSQHLIANVQACREENGVIRSAAYFNAVIFGSEGASLVCGRYDDLLREESGRLSFLRKGNQVDYTVQLGSVSKSFLAS